MWTIRTVVFLGLVSFGLNVKLGTIVLEGETECEDVGVNIADGTVFCKYLREKSDWGIHTRAKWHCTSDPNTECCKTCKQLAKELGFTYGSGSAQAQSMTPPTTKAPPTKAPPTKAPPPPKAPPECEDVGVNIADGTVFCKYLREKSDWGIHTRAEWHCTSDPNTECCKTCKQLAKELGFTYSSGSAQAQNQTPLTTKAPPTKAPPTKAPPPPKAPPVPVDSSCVDSGAWMADMSVDCKYLETPSHWGLHNKQEHYCMVDPLVECCETCARLGYRKGSSQGQPVTTKKPTTTITTTTVAPTKRPVPVKPTKPLKPSYPAGPFCRDRGIKSRWGGRTMSCKLLEKKSAYRYHVNPTYHCQTSAMQWQCCATCKRLQVQNTYTGYNVYTFKFTSFPKKSKMSNEIQKR